MQMPQVTTIYRLCSIKGGGWSWHKSDGDNFEHTEKFLENGTGIVCTFEKRYL